MKIYSLFEYHCEALNSRVEKILISYFKYNSRSNRAFNYFIQNVHLKLNDYINKYEGAIKETYPKVLDFFKERHHYYSGSDSQIIEQILINEIRDLVPGSALKDYRGLVIKLAVLESLRDIKAYLRNNASYYQLVYDTGSYNLFLLNGFRGKSSEDSLEYGKMVNKKYGNECINEDNANQFMTGQVGEGNDKFNEEKEKVFSHLKLITDDERLVLANLIFDQIKKSNSNLGLLDFVKLIKIIGQYEDVSIFNQKPANNTLYQKASQGLLYYRESRQKTILESLNEKTAFLESKLITSLINRQLTKLTNKRR